MNSRTPDNSTEVPPERLSQLFMLVAHPWRRLLLYWLVDGERRAVLFTDLLVRVRSLAAESQAVGRPRRRDLAAALRHTHLPKLDEAGVISWTPETDTIRYTPTPALEQVVALVRTLELGDA